MSIFAIVQYLEQNTLPESPTRVHRITAQASLFEVIDQVLYFIDSRQPSGSRIVVPKHFKKQIMEEYHASTMAGHFSRVQDLDEEVVMEWYVFRLFGVL